MRDMGLRLGFLTIGGTTVLLSMAGALVIAGVWDKFWHWTVEYAQAYLGVVTFSTGLGYLANAAGGMWAAAPGLWLLVALGMMLLWCDTALRRWRFFLVALIGFSFVGVCPGYYFRPHYFLLLLPAASLLCGAAWCAWTRSVARLLDAIAPSSRKAGAPGLSWLNRPGFALAAGGTFGGLFLLAAAQFLAASGDIFFQLPPDVA